MRYAGFTAVLVLCAGSCVALPKPPAEREELDELWQRYEEPTATLNANDAMALSTATGWLAQARLVAGFRFVQPSISDAVERVSSNTELSDLVRAQGKIQVREPCPGHGEEPTTDIEENGYFDVVLGVRSSSIQRTFTGHTERCHFLTTLPSGDPVEVTLTTDFVADMGERVGLGSEIPTQTLVSATDLTVVVSGSSVSVSEQYAAVDFRLSETALETLVELPAAGVDGDGSAVVVAYQGGAIGIRVSDGEWQCGTSDTACLQ